MKVFYDNKAYYIQKSGGVSVVNYELQKRALLNEDIDCAFIDYGECENPYRSEFEYTPVKVIRKSSSLFKLRRLLPVSVKCDEPFIFHSTYFSLSNNRNAINITTAHDFIESKLKRNFGTLSRTMLQTYVCKHSDYVVCISENTKKDLLDLIPSFDESRVRVIYNGVSDVFCIKGDVSANLPFEAKSYVIFVGGRDRYKNFNLLCNAIGSTNYNLVMTGKPLRQDEESSLLSNIPKERFKNVGFVSEEELCTLYNNAAALIYPSSYEGFGLPVLEAQKSGCPVIALNATSIPEVIGNTPLLMQEATEKELLEKINLLSNEVLINKVVADGIQNASRFSWDKMAREYFDLYSYALSNKIQ